MRTNAVQDLRAFEARLFEAVQEALRESPAIGVAINPNTLECQACTKTAAVNSGMEWREANEMAQDNEASYDAVADVAAEYCFVR